MDNQTYCNISFLFYRIHAIIIALLTSNLIIIGINSVFTFLTYKKDFYCIQRVRTIVDIIHIFVGIIVSLLTVRHIIPQALISIILVMFYC